MIPKLAEATQTAVANTLETYLPDVLTAISAAYNDGIPLPAPAHVYDGKSHLVREYPSLMVAAGTGGQKSNAAPEWGLLEHHLDIVGFLRSDSHEVVDKMALRYLQAIWEVLMAHQDLDGSISGLSGVNPLEYANGPTTAGPMKQLDQQVIWTVAVSVMEGVG